jgi:hypothetical protein
MVVSGFMDLDTTTDGAPSLRILTGILEEYT